VPVGLGPEWEGNTGARWQEPCAAGYALSCYAGAVIEDGVQAMINVIINSPEPVTVIAIGPLPTVAEALRREPGIAENARFVGMHGSLRLGHKNDRDTVVAEANVVNDAAACQAVFAAPWSVTITPTDSCGIVQLEGGRHRRVVDSTDPLARCVMTNYQTWWNGGERGDFDLWQRQSSILFDTVAVYVAFSEGHLVMEQLPIQVTSDGFTRIEPDGRPTNCATGWKDLKVFLDLLAERIAGSDQRPLL